MHTSAWPFPGATTSPTGLAYLCDDWARSRTGAPPEGPRVADAARSRRARSYGDAMALGLPPTKQSGLAGAALRAAAAAAASPESLEAAAGAACGAAGAAWRLSLAASALGAGGRLARVAAAASGAFLAGAYEAAVGTSRSHELFVAPGAGRG